mgnify:CR=1 FL=1
MERNFINFNGVLINTHYIKKIYKTKNSHISCSDGRTFHDKYYEIRINVYSIPGTHVETYLNEKDRDYRFFGLITLLCPNL